MPRTPTGSDTRMYSPRSESNLGYSKDDDAYAYGQGDPEQQELMRDKKQSEKEQQTYIADLPHLQISIPKTAPSTPPMMPEEEEEPMMDNQFNEGQQFGAMTGMPDTGNLSIGNATGTMPAPGGMLATGEPMNDAWSTLMKEDEDVEEGEDDEIPDRRFNKKPPPIDMNAEINRLRRLAAEPVIEMRENEQREEMIRPTAHGNPDYFRQSEPMKDAWSTLLKKDDDVPDMSNFGAPYDPDTRIPELSMDDLYRLLQHPNSRIRHKANEEMQMRSMDAEGSNLPFDINTTPAGEVAAFYEPQFQDLNFQYGNQQPPDLEDGEYNEEGYDEHYSQARASDVLEAMPGDIEFFPSLAAKYEHLKNTAPPDVVENYRNRIKDFFDNYTQPSEILGTTLPPQFTPELPKGTFYTPEEVMQQSDKINEALNIYPGGNRAYTGFTDDFQNILASEPMKDAWSTLMKARLDKVKGAKDKSWKQTQFKIQPGGADITTANTRRAKLQSRFLQPHKKRGVDLAPLSVHRTHLGIETKQPQRLFPRDYGHQMATQARRKLMGNVPQIPAGHGLGPEQAYNPRSPKQSSSKGLSLTEPRTIRERGKSFAKAAKEDLEEISKRADYMQFTQMRRLLRRLKELAEKNERRLKSKEQSGHGNNREAGHREAQNSTTKPEGATENLEDDPKNWGAPSTLFAARGSGRVG